MMKRIVALLATLTILALAPSQAHAQRRGNGTVNTPYGQFNMNDMRAAGGDPFAAEQLREQRLAYQYQQNLIRQQQRNMQQMAKQQKSKTAPSTANSKSSTVPPAKSKNAASGKAKGAKSSTKEPTGSAFSTKATPGSSKTPKVPGAPDN